MKFECSRDPPHKDCKGTYRQHRVSTGRGSRMIKWAPCREAEAIEFMKTELHHTYKSCHVENHGKSKHRKSHDKEHPAEQSTPSGPSLNQQNLDAMQEAIDQEDTLEEEATTRQQNQYQQQFPTKAKYMTPFNQGCVRDWMDERIYSNQGKDSSQGMMSPQGTYAAGAQNTTAAPVIQSPQTPTEGQRRRSRRHRSRREPESGPEQYPQPGPSMRVSMVSPTAMPVPPLPPSDQGVMDRQQRQLHHREPSVHSSHQQTPLSPDDMPPPPTMRQCMEVMAEEAMSAPLDDSQAGGMVTAPSVCNMPLRMNQMMCAPPPQNMPMRQGPQQVPGMSLAPPAPGTSLPPPTMPVASTQNIALCPAGQAVLEMSGPPRMQLPMGPPQAEGIFTTPGTTNAPPPTKATMTTRSTTQNIGPRPGQQPGPGTSPAPPTAGMYGTRETQLPPMGTPQAGGITIAAGPSGRLPQNPPLRQPRPQLTNPGMLLRSAGAAGMPGSQAMAPRPPPGVLSTMPETPPNPSMQPPPASMPPFPGTGPGTPASLDLAVAPPPPAPTPPLYPGALG
ncbi:hypothetical protein LA080_001567 [Diaporthe eres]|nr:hypothetical protein LA080_001567 [Diaporthe eres]